MTQDEIIRMAREAGAIQVDGKTAFYTDDIEHFAALVAAHERNRLAWTQEHWTEYEHAIAAAEREACAKMCEEIGGSIYVSGRSQGADFCAAAIRSRGEK